MQINPIYTNPYNKNYNHVSERQINKPQYRNLSDTFAVQQNSQIAFTGILNLFKSAPKAPEIVLSEAEQAAQLAEKAAREMGRRIRRFNDDPNLVIMSYLTKTPYTKENAAEFVKYLYSHELNLKKRYYDAPKDYGLWHRSIAEGMDSAGEWSTQGIFDAQNYKTHILLKHWEESYINTNLGYYVSRLHLLPEDLKSIRGWFDWFIENGIHDRFGAQTYDNHCQEFYSGAIKKQNIPLLKFLIEDLKLKPYNMYSTEIQRGVGEVWIAGREILNGRNHKNPEIRKLFDDEHLYQLFLNTDRLTVANSRFGLRSETPFWTICEIGAHAYEDKGLAVFLKSVINSEKGAYEKGIMLDNALDGHIHALGENYYNSEKYSLCQKSVSELPIAPTERRMYSQRLDDNNMTLHTYSDRIAPFNYMRAENVIRKNVPDGIFTIESLKKCLDDSIMSPEILIHKGNKTSVFEEISKIKVDSSNQAEMRELIQKIRDMKYLFHDKSLNEIGYNAAINNNADLLRLLKENHVDLSEAAGVLNSKNISAEIRTILSDVKVHDIKIVDFAKNEDIIAFHIYSRKNLDSVDINSRAQNGTTLLLEAAKNGNVELIRELTRIPEVDWNITDSVGKNVLMHLIDYAAQNHKETERGVDIINILKTLPKDKFDINYINYCSNYICPFPHTAIQYGLANKLIYQHPDVAKQYGLQHNLSKCLLRELLDFPNIDINTHAENSLPTAYIPILNGMPKQLKFIIEHSDVDTLAPYKDKTLRQHLFSHELFAHIDSNEAAAPYERLLDNKANNIFINKMKKIYDRDGSFTLEQINDFINYGQIERLKDEPLNSIGERIPHFISEIFPEEGNPYEMEEIYKLFDKLHEKQINIDILDGIGRSPLRKAIEADNSVIAKLFLEYGSKPADIEEIKTLCRESNNPEIRKLFE